MSIKPRITFDTAHDEGEDCLNVEAVESNRPPTRLKSKKLVQPSLLSKYSCCKPASVIKPGHDGVRELLEYDHRLLMTVRCMCLRHGTVLTKRVLWMEEFFTIGVYLVAWLCTVTIVVVDESVKERLVKQAEDLMDICGTLTTITIFLMGTFTVVNFDRWQNLRQVGVEPVWRSASAISMITATFVTRDERVLQAIDRYARASLMLIFMHQRNRLDAKLLVRRGVLTPEEVSHLEPLENGMLASMSVWTWTSGIFHGLSKKGLIKSDPLLRYLVDQCSHGQTAANRVLTLLTAPVPMSYFALISAVVKCHNLSYAVIFGAVSTVQIELHGRTTLVACTVMWFLLSVVFNALLIINQELVNPFNGKAKDTNFPMKWLDESMKKDMANNHALAANLPDWVLGLGIMPLPAELISDAAAR